ncbi:MAG: DUF4249 domain-containing protein [Tannerella sp.]|jgi:hypothetical protein|nr:DUF4249 domain-containing protein [Tannerella sp.]
MKPTTITTAILCTLLLCTGCESDVNYRGEGVSAKMVLNSMINSGETSQLIKVSESVFVFSDQKPKPVDNPNLALRINGFPVEVTYDHSVREDRYYRFNAVLNPGDRMEISGDSQSHGHLSGSDVIPYPPQIVDVAPEWFTGTADGISYLRTTVKIKDRPNENNYYRIVIHTKTVFSGNDPDDITWQNQEVHVDQEILFKEISGSLGDANTSLFAIFSDELFRGREYSLNVYIRHDNFSQEADQYVRVEIHTLSENLYKYLRSLEVAASGDNFTEPVKIFTNIEGGFGILGTYTTGQMTIEMK